MNRSKTIVPVALFRKTFLDLRTGEEIHLNQNLYRTDAGRGTRGRGDRTPPRMHPNDPRNPIYRRSRARGPRSRGTPHPKKGEQPEKTKKRKRSRSGTKTPSPRRSRSGDRSPSPDDRSPGPDDQPGPSHKRALFA
ncbi:hypothetical protein HA402_004139 [Bradysia odoriphaga]|nr:hypothetical protein HA402_004139 [Bradysia odoriphaga]